MAAEGPQGETNKDSASRDENQFLHRTKDLAMRIMQVAVSDGTEASIEIAKSAIAIFCKSAAEWLTANIAVDVKERGNPRTSIRAAIVIAVQDEAANRILADLETTMGKDFEAELSGAGSCSSSASAMAGRNLREFIATREGLDESMQILLREMTGACLDITDELIDSTEFANDLLEWGIIMSSTIAAPATN